MPSKLQETGLSYLEGLRFLSPELFLDVLHPSAVHIFAPASVNPPPPLTPATFVNHLNYLKEVLIRFPVYAKEIFKNEANGQITIWATSETIFQEEVKDTDVSDEEWKYQGEYIFVLTMDEKHGKIKGILEFVDSKGTEKLRGLMARARGNLQSRNQ